MKLLTEVSLPDYPFTLNHQSNILMMGSCFTENMGRLMERYLFPVNVNPFGVTYNPMSVKRGLEALMQKESYGEEDLERFNNLWYSFDHSTKFSASEREKALASINQAFQEAKRSLKEANFLILTWGTSWVYSYKDTGRVVNNCHKIPASKFDRSRLSDSEIVVAYEEVLQELFNYNPQLKVLHTVSPVRHWKDGAHGNQLSKASLLLAGDALEQKFPRKFFYFPSYEIVMDELRDYRFYADDMLHTNEQATMYIWEKFQDAFMEKHSVEILGQIESIRKIIEHRPMNPVPELDKQRDLQLKEKLEMAENKYPELNWRKLYESAL